MDIGIMLDVSGSIQQENFQYAVDFMKELVNQLDIDSGKVLQHIHNFYAQFEFYFVYTELSHFMLKII